MVQEVYFLICTVNNFGTCVSDKKKTEQKITLIRKVFNQLIKYLTLSAMNSTFVDNDSSINLN